MATKASTTKSTLKKVVSKTVAAVKSAVSKKKPVAVSPAPVAAVERITIRFDQKTSRWSRVNPDKLEEILGPADTAVLKDVVFSSTLITEVKRVPSFCSSHEVRTSVYVGVATGTPSDVGSLNLATFVNLGFDKDNGKFTVEGRPLTKAKALYLGGARFATAKL